MHSSDERLPKEANFQPGSRTGTLVAVGMLSIALGGFALVFPLWASLGLELVIGAALVVVGITELIRARSFGTGRSAWAVLFGILAIVAGLLLLFFPLQGVVTLSVLLIAFFLGGGVVKTMTAFQLRPTPGWGWLLTSGLLSFGLGLLILIALPSSALWVLGLLFGIDLVLFGVAQLVYGLGRREASRIDPVS